MPLPIVDSISATFLELRAQLARIEVEWIPVSQSAGRILADPLASFRDSPANDVSAMDGYALRLGDARSGPISICGIARAGAPPVPLISGQACRIFTGASLPEGAECVVPREQCVESDAVVELTIDPAQIRFGQHIRRRGENAKAGDTVLASGTLLHGASLSSVVSFGAEDRIRVYRRLRVAILNTGDELHEPGAPIQDWQIRDSNGPLLEGILNSLPWVQVRRSRVGDDPEAIRTAIEHAIETADALLITGGVSMGDTDHVPQSIQDAGGRIAFHRIPIRPGKPMLGAVGPRGQLILGLPGNPVSVAVTFRRFGLPLLQWMAGVDGAPWVPFVEIENPDAKTLDMVWFRLVRRTGDGTVALLKNQGSGDIAALGMSDGFVEVPPGATSQGMRRYFDWKG
jgi:molybdopterin molybdotransferase